MNFSTPRSMARGWSDRQVPVPVEYRLSQTEGRENSL